MTAQTRQPTPGCVIAGFTPLVLVAVLAVGRRPWLMNPACGAAAGDQPY